MWPRCKSPRSTFSAARRSGTAAATISICRCRRFPPTAEPQIDTTIPAVTAIAETPSTGDLNAGKTVSIMLTVGEAVTVTGTPTLTLSDNGTATYTGISADGKTLTFGYTVGSADTNVASLQVTSINLPGGATIQDGGGNNLNVSLSAVPAYSGPQIDTTIPAVTAIAETPSTGDLNAGKTVTITLTTGEAVTVSGSPMLILSAGVTATYSRISTDGKALTFSYTVGSADTNVASLQVTSINLPGGATIQDGGGNNLNLSLSAVPAYSGPQIDTTIPAVTAIAETPSTGDLNAGKAVSITLSVGEAVTVTGTPTLTLSDNGTATYSRISTDGKMLTFSYTVGSADTNVASLQVTSLNLPGGATIRDGGGNNLNVSLSAVPTYSGPQIDTTIPAVTTVAEAPSTGNLSVGSTVTITLTVGEAVTVTGAPTLTLNDQGTATYTGISSNGKTLTFTYTVKSTDSSVPSLQVSSINLPGGATIRDGGGNNFNLSLSAVPTYSGPAVDQVKVAEVPSLTTSGNVTVSAGGSKPLGITVIPNDSDDTLSVKISNVPSFETITAPNGDVVTRSGNTYTITAPTGQAINNLMVHSSYNGKGHPQNTFNITATNLTVGETATSASKSIIVTDPRTVEGKF